jgi:hypothetical protein
MPATGIFELMVCPRLCVSSALNPPKRTNGMGGANSELEPAAMSGLLNFRHKE